MIIYFEAKKTQNSVPDQVLLAWVKGFKLLVENYCHEYVFDSSQSKNRFTLISEVYIDEEKTLLQNLGQDYKPRANYWSFFTKERINGYSWLPFGTEFKREVEEGFWGWSRTKPITSLEDLPEMAIFADKVVMQEHTLTEPDWKNLPRPEWKDRGFNARAHGIRNWYKKENLEGLINRAIDSFACKLPSIPYYDSLREGLVSLYLFSDRHLSRRSKSFGEDPLESPIEIIPLNAPDRGRGNVHPCMGAFFDLETSRPKIAYATKKYYPEVHLPLTEEKHRSLKDLNQRIQIVLSTNKRLLPFMTLQEEKEYIAFVQKDSLTRFTEAISFFKKILPKLAFPDYQLALEHLLFNAEGIDFLEALFNAQNDPLAVSTLDLLFNLISTGYETLLKKSLRTQSGAAFLFHLHLRLFQMKEQYHSPNIEKEKTILYSAWENLLRAGKENPILGIALGEAVCAAAPTMEQGYSLINEKKYLHLLTTTLLLQCIPGNYTQSKYHPLLLTYGYQSFKALMLRTEDAIAIWQSAAKEVFTPEEASLCKWDPEKGFLTLKTLKLNLVTHTIDGSDDFKMRLLPKNITEEYYFRKYFGKRSFLGNFRREEFSEIYAFSWKQRAYEVHCDTKSGDIQIYKEFEGIFYQKIASPIDLETSHHLTKENNFWQNQETIFVENKISRSIESLRQF